MTRPVFLLLVILLLTAATTTVRSIRFPSRLPDRLVPPFHDDRPLKVAVFALGSFWRSEAAFSCLDGVFRTAVGYSGGSKLSPTYRSLGNHAECVQVEYDPTVIRYEDLLDVFWSSHDSRQVFGQGPDVGNQYRSIIFTNETKEFRSASESKEKEQTKLKSSIVTTQIQPLGTFYPAEPEHQKFELKQNGILLQMMGNMPEEELQRSSLAGKLNSYAAELCPPRIQKKIEAKINNILRKGNRTRIMDIMGVREVEVHRRKERGQLSSGLPEELAAKKKLREKVQAMSHV